jgi:signal peptidase I
MTRRLLNLATTLVACVALLAFAPSLLGLHRYVITSGSMGRAIPAGSIVLDRDVASAAVRRGDIITFVPPGHARAITHRVAAADRHVLATRGDANRTNDPWTLSRAGTVRRVVAHVPYAGYAVAALQAWAVRALLVALLAGALGVSLAVGALRELRASGPREELAR